MHHRIIEVQIFETTKWSLLEGYNIRRIVIRIFTRKPSISVTYAKPKEGIRQIIALCQNMFYFRYRAEVSGLLVRC